MSNTIDALNESIHLNREELINNILEKLGYKELDQKVFDELVLMVIEQDEKRFKYLKALEAQQVVDHFMKNKLV